MNIKIEGDPGTGNTFQEINIGTVQNYNPNATTVINYNGTGNEEQKRDKSKAKSLMEQRDPSPIREDILSYVSDLNTKKLVSADWLGARYMDLWDKLLDIPEVEAEIYNPGKQQGTSFNRNLVANIIHYLGTQANEKRQVYKNFSGTSYTSYLEGDTDHSVRRALGKNPSDEIKKSLDKFMENYLL